MSIPDYQTIMKPLLEFLNSNSGPQRMQDVTEAMSLHFSLTEEEIEELLPSGQQSVIHNRVGWARTYLKKAGLLNDPKRGYVEISEKGKEVLSKNPPEINVKFLNQFPDFQEFRKKRNKQIEESDDVSDYENNDTDIPPNEMVEKGIELINADLAEELLGKIERNSPAFFESIVLDLLSSMGYGKGKVTGRSGDGGIDGFISQDALGIEKIYFQAKRFTGNTKVSASMIRDFVGSLDLQGVSKGVFITSSDFPQDTEKVLAGTHKSIVLINQSKLLSLMIQYNIGVSVEKIFEMKRIDSDYFPED
ncbi:MAG TPA: winged helix-turn-helix domain-containing protein [Spirochaetota bacterium]|nr:winged helix-turn-helix domain-containing protein [Spirochaetota bacterium]